MLGRPRFTLRAPEVDPTYVWGSSADAGRMIVEAIERAKAKG
jgi:hypothetical protein